MATEHNITITATDSEGTSAVKTLKFTKETTVMPTTKKYVSLEKLGLYDEKIKAKMAADDAVVAAEAKAYADGLASNYDAAGSAASVQSALDAEIARATAAEVANKALADAAQADVDALEILVGTLPTDATATDIVGYVQEKTSGIASDTALSELTERVAQAEADIDAIEADYLKVADKTELSDAITTEQTRATEIEAGLRTDVDAITADYLKNVDKTELQDNIDAVDALVDTLIGDDTGKSARTIANEELAKQLITENAAESLNELQEIAAWIQSHPGDASAMNQAIQDLETLVGELPADVIATDIVGYIQEAVSVEKIRAEAAESGLSDRITDLEGSVGSGGSVSDMISEAIEAEKTAREAAIAEVQADADQGIADAAAALAAANAADAKAQTAQDEVDALELVVDTKAAASDLTALDGRVTTVEGKVAILEGQMTAVEAKATANETAITGLQTSVSGKADQTALQAEIDRAKAAEEANAAAIAAFVECSEEEINGLFA